MSEREKKILPELISTLLDVDSEDHTYMRGFVDGIKYKKEQNDEKIRQDPSGGDQQMGNT